MWATWIPLFLLIGFGFALTVGIVIYSLFAFLFHPSVCTASKPKTHSRHYHYRHRQLLHHLPHHHYRSTRFLYQLRRYKVQKCAILIAHNWLIASFNGRWGSTDLPMEPLGTHTATTSAATSVVFGTPADWHNELLTNKHQFMDPIKQICSLKNLSGGSFLATELHRKHT